VIANVVLFTSAVNPSNTSGDAPNIFEPDRVTFPVVTVNPFDAVNNPAEVIVPVLVVEIFPEVETELGVIAPRPIVKAGVGDAIDQVAVTPLLAAAVETAVTVPPLPLEVRVPPESVRPEPIVISSTAPVEAVVLPSILAVDIVIPSDVIEPGAT